MAHLSDLLVSQDKKITQMSSLVDDGIFTTVLPEYYIEIHTNMFEIAFNRTPTPLAAMEAEHAQGR